MNAKLLFLKLIDGIHPIESFYKSVYEFKCDLDNVGPLKQLLPKNDTMQDIKFAPEDETWILGRCIKMIHLQHGPILRGLCSKFTSSSLRENLTNTTIKSFIN